MGSVFGHIKGSDTFCSTPNSLPRFRPPHTTLTRRVLNLRLHARRMLSLVPANVCARCPFGSQRAVGSTNQQTGLPTAPKVRSERSNLTMPPIGRSARYGPICTPRRSVSCFDNPILAATRRADTPEILRGSTRSAKLDGDGAAPGCRARGISPRQQIGAR